MTEFISTERARRILAPLTGDDLRRHRHDHGPAFERLFDRIKRGEVQFRTTRPTPHHGDPAYNGVKDIPPDWFSKWRSGHLTGEALQQWEDWFYHDGIEVSLEDVLKIDRPDYVTSHDEITAVESLEHWSFPMLVAWVATRQLSPMAQVCAPLTDFRKRPTQEARPLEIDPNLLTWREGARRRALGWLQKTVSEHHCKCGSAGNDERERWQMCICLKHAINEIKDAIRANNIAPIVQLGGRRDQPLSIVEIDSLGIDLGSFELRIPEHAELIEFDTQRVRAQWPASVADSDVQADPSVYLGSLAVQYRREWTKKSYREAVKLKFPGVSDRKFDDRIWPSVANEYGLSKPGRRSSDVQGNRRT